MISYMELMFFRVILCCLINISPDVPHRQWVFTIPKRLRPYFMCDRKLLAKLSLCAWKILSEYLKAGVTADNPVSGCVIAVQTFGELLNFNPHLHVIATDGCFYDDGRFMSGITPDPDDLNAAFSADMLGMLKKNNKISGAVINDMSSWEHSVLVIPLRSVARPCDLASVFIAGTGWTHRMLNQS